MKFGKLDLDWREIYTIDYIQNEKTMTEISKQYKCGVTTVYKYFKYEGLSVRRTGPENLGLSELNNLIRASQSNINWRKAVFLRDEFTCQKCFKVGGQLEAHHIFDFNKILKKFQITTLAEAINCIELWDIKNGQTLCKKCHLKTY